MKLAIRGHDLGKKGEFDLIERLNEFGFDGVQLVPYKAFDYVPYSPEISDEVAGEIAKSLSDADKQVFLIGAYFNPVHSLKEKVKNGVETFKRYIELSKVFNTSLVGSETGSFNDDKWTYNPLNRTDEALDTVIKTFSSLSEYAEKFGVFVGMEGAAGHVCWNVDRLNKAISEIGWKNIKVIFDIYNYLDDENYAEYLKILEKGLETFDGKIHCFHMKDCCLVDGKLKQCAIGKGIFDYKRVLSLIKQSNPDATLVLEGTTGEDILPSVQLIRDLWSKM